MAFLCSQADSINQSCLAIAMLRLVVRGKRAPLSFVSTEACIDDGTKRVRWLKQNFSLIPAISFGDQLSITVILQWVIVQVFSFSALHNHHHIHVHRHAEWWPVQRCKCMLLCVKGYIHQGCAVRPVTSEAGYDVVAGIWCGGLGLWFGGGGAMMTRKPRLARRSHL